MGLVGTGGQPRWGRATRMWELFHGGRNAGISSGGKELELEGHGKLVRRCPQNCFERS